MFSRITAFSLPLLLLFAGTRGDASKAAVLIEGVPHHRQRPDFCGEACASMMLAKLGHDFDQDYVFDQSGLDPLEGRGCRTPELARALEKIGFKVGPVWHSVDARKPAGALKPHWEGLLEDLKRQVASIVCMRYSAEAPSEHFRLILGYDPQADEVIYHEPAEDGGSYRRMARARFLDLWPLKYEAERWTAIRLRLEPGKIEPRKTVARRAGGPFTLADYAQHVRELRKKSPPGFTVVLSVPFVVIGDEPPAVLKRRAEGTVGWAVRMLKKSYFRKDPGEILDIWLFKDKESYEKNAKRLFQRAPSTPFGYYSSADRALVMNIATGGGTLVHEIVHPFLASNFPRCPAWFSEGLASLYEQCEERDGRIWGSTNWRLEGLQKAIRAGENPTFKELTSTTDHGFYNMDRGTNYAQARYLCLYLQEKGLLEKYYRDFVASAEKDPTGYETLKKVLGKDEKQMGAFKKDWEAYVLRLRFP